MLKVPPTYKLLADPAAVAKLYDMRGEWPELRQPKNWARFMRAVQSLVEGNEPVTDRDVFVIAHAAAGFVGIWREAKREQRRMERDRARAQQAQPTQRRKGEDT